MPNEPAGPVHLVPRRAAAWFEPAWRDLWVGHLGRLTGAANRRQAATVQVRYRLALAWLVLDCWRLSVFDRSQSASATTTPKPREPFQMFASDVRHSVRRLIREPGFTLATGLTLALGVGANVAVFAVVEAVLLRPLPYDAPHQLVVIRNRDQQTGVTKPDVAIGDAVDLAGRQSAFSAVGGYAAGQATVFGEGEPFQVHALRLTSGAFKALGVRPAVGRGLTDADSRVGAGPVMLLGYDLWLRRFGGDSSIVGRSIKVGQETRLVVGVAPRNFGFPPSGTTDLILSGSLPEAAPAARKEDWTFMLARLKPGASVAAATANLGMIAGQLERDFPATNRASTYYAVSLRDEVVGNTRTALILLLGAVAAVLLIACVNVANLMLARSVGRQREMAVRLSLGAGRNRIAAQMLVESLVLVSASAAVGVGFAHFGARALVAMIPSSVGIAGLAEIGINPTVLGFTLLLTVVTALGFGLVSTLATASDGTARTLMAGRAGMISRGARRASAVLVAGEMAFAVVLLIGAGLILRSFAGLLSTDPGFRVDQVATVALGLPADRYDSLPAREAFYQRAFEAIRAVPGVLEVGAAVVTPLTGNHWTTSFERTGYPVPPGERAPLVGWQVASGGYFKALAIPLKAGRFFDQRDRPGNPPAVIISEALRRQFFGTENPIGTTINDGDERIEIVGVVGDIRRAGLAEEPRPDLYFPFERSPSQGITLFIRTEGDPARATSGIHGALRSIEPSVVLLQSRTMADIASDSVQVTRLMLWLLGIFALIALALAVVGIYGVISYLIRQRTREIGTRLALGASRSAILWMVMRQGALIVGTGAAIGLIVGVLAARTLESMLYGVTAADPLVVAGATTVLILTALAGCYVPARRAASVDPAITLTVT